MHLQTYFKGNQWVIIQNHRTLVQLHLHYMASFVQSLTLVHLFFHLVFEAFKFITPITAIHNTVCYGNHCLCFNSQAYSMTKKKKK